ETDSGYANEEQSMSYYETADTENPNATFSEAFRDSIDTTEDYIVTDNTVYPIFYEEIYVEHIMFDDQTNTTLENTDEELYRVPIFEERVQVIKEKVLTGELVVRKRKK
ncbi:MAG: DUF2382 domain-containing protein, partial [Paenisporosarcina sp.]